MIHTDFQRGFIKADVVSYDDLLKAGSMAEARAKGLVRVEGKDYVMADGDVVEFRFNVQSAGDHDGNAALARSRAGGCHRSPIRAGRRACS